MGRFDGGRISSDGGCVLLREVEERTHILKRLAGCFVDHRDPELIEHSVGSLVKQRVYGIALGYEDLNDHDTLRYDALLGVLADKEDPSGAGRRRTEDRGKAEYLAKGETPRFIVTSLAPEDWEARALYEVLYCARGEMENRIKEQQLQLFADPRAPTR